MARVNVWNRPPQGRKQFTKTFQDIDEMTGEDKDEPFTFTFQRMNDSEESKAYENSEALTLRYVGDPDNGIDPVTTLPPVGGKVVNVTQRMCLNACVLEMMQPEGLPEEDRYSAEELLALRSTLAKQTRDEITLWVNEIKKVPKKKAKSDSSVDQTDTSENSAPV